MPEEVAQQLKLVAVYERTTIQDFCLQAILPSLAKALKKHGLTPPEPLPTSAFVGLPLPVNLW